MHCIVTNFFLNRLNFNYPLCLQNSSNCTLLLTVVYPKLAEYSLFPGLTNKSCSNLLSFRTHWDLSIIHPYTHIFNYVRRDMIEDWIVGHNRNRVTKTDKVFSTRYHRQVTTVQKNKTNKQTKKLVLKYQYEALRIKTGKCVFKKCGIGGIRSRSSTEV